MNKSIFLLPLFVLACAPADQPTGLDAKKSELDKSRKELADLKARIGELEAEIRKEDPTFGRSESSVVLVTTLALERKPFEHFIDLRGSVQSRKNITLSSVTGGEIERVHVREGDKVTKGDLLVSLDAEVVRNSIAELQTALELANSVYEKQARLWEQKIGTEVQYLQAKNNKESLERRLSTARSQLNQLIIKSPFAGSVDEVMAREGEVASPGMPLVRVVNPEAMYVEADVSEKYIGQFRAGDPVEILFPSQDRRVKSNVASIAQVINEQNRTFRVELTLPRTDFATKPNQVAIVTLRDYVNREAFVLPTRLLQRDREGLFVYAIDKTTAMKVRVSPGLSFNGMTEITEGLTGTEVIVDEGYREVTEGVEVAIATPQKESVSLAKQ
jgi:RND family efflux transporter MFP subunit